jgi:plasmid maintenance system antidote protein VapI
MSKRTHPHTLFDFLMKECGLRTDASLAKALEVTAPTVSRIRSGKTRVTADIILRIHKTTGLSVESIEAMIEEK